MSIDVSPPDLSESTMVDMVDQYKRIMRQRAAGVAVITTYLDEPLAFCATSLASVSLTPPMVSFAVQNGSRSCRAWATATHGVVHLLHDGQKAVAESFARPGRQKFANAAAWHLGPFGQPVLHDVLAWMVVETVSRTEAGDHLLVLARAVAGDADPRRAPLIYQNGNYRSMTK